MKRQIIITLCIFFLSPLLIVRSSEEGSADENELPDEVFLEFLADYEAEDEIWDTLDSLILTPAYQRGEYQPEADIKRQQWGQ